MTAAGIRARVRAEMSDQIKATARKHLATDGANLSLRAVARDVGLVSSAVYRYFASRDELLTALIMDAYDALGEAVERAEAAVDRADLTGRLLACAHAARAWALANPHEYGLLYGTPVPGYRAPQDTIGPASRPVVVLTSVLVEAVREQGLRARGSVPDPVGQELAAVAAGLGAPDLPQDVLGRGMALWVTMFGLISFELFGRLKGGIEDYDAFYDYELSLLVGLLGPLG